jgi:hypothetical protein
MVAYPRLCLSVAVRPTQAMADLRRAVWLKVAAKVLDVGKNRGIDVAGATTSRDACRSRS